MKRVIVATLAGVLSGLICVGMVLSGSGELPWPLIPQILSSRVLIGVAIGISSLWLGHWSIHGLVMGAVFSLPLAFSGLMAPDSPNYDKTVMWIMTVALGMIYGMLIEFITTVLFNAKQGT